MNQIVANRHQRTNGFILGAIAAITYGMNPLFAVPLYEQGMNADSVLLFRYIAAIPIVAAMLVFRGRTLRLPRQSVASLAILGIVLAVSSLGLFMSYNYMNSGIASTLLFIYPIMVAVIMAIFYQERMTVRLILCISVALLGIALLYKNEQGATLSFAGTMLVALSALSYAVYLVAINNKKLKGMPTLMLTFYVLLFGSALFIVRVIFFTELTLPVRWYYWGNLLGLAIFPTAISFICTTRAIQLIGSTPTAILGALEPAAAIFFGVTLLGQSLTPRELFGLIMIILSVTVVIAGKSVSSVLVRFRNMFPRIAKRKHNRND